MSPLSNQLKTTFADWQPTLPNAVRLARFTLAWSLHRVAKHFADAGNIVLFGPRTKQPERERIR